MIPRGSDITVDSTLSGEKIGMTLDASAAAHLMGVLTDLYEDPEAAVVREYATNARDSHTEAGQARPIEVTTPTPLAPFFVVKDYGVGLDRDDIEAIYSRYGASTKRGTDAQTGMLGLGCKAGLTYASQFTLVGIKAGARTQVAVARDADGAGSMTVVSVGPTTEPNGVEVTVPAKRHNDFAAKARRLFGFWPAGSVLLDGEPPAPVEGLRVSDDMLIAPDPERDGAIIVMGGVPYPAGRIDGLSLPWGQRLIAWVEPGAVHFTPSREGLQDTPATKAALAAVAAAFEAQARRTAAADIAKAATAFEAARTASRWSRAVGGIDDLKWRGRPTSGRLDANEDQTLHIVPRESYRVTQCAKQTYADAGWAADAVWVDGYRLTGWTAPRKRKLEAWVRDHGGIAADRYVLCDEIPAAARDYIDPALRAAWADINAVKLPRAAAPARSAGARPTGAYDCRIKAKGQPPRYALVQAGDINTKLPLYWIHGNRYSGEYRYAEALTVGAYTLVCLPANRIEKFKRDFPMARKAYDVLNAERDAWVKGLTPDDLLAMRIQGESGPAAKLAGWDPTAFDDPELSALARAAGRKLNGHLERMRTYRNRALPAVPLPAAPTTLKNYPLLVSDYYGGLTENKKHGSLYCNAVYAARQSGDKL